MTDLGFLTRKLSRQFFVKTLPGPAKAKKHLIVTGLPRSGTSWLAKAISLADNVSYYFEPDQQLGNEFMHKYVPESEKNEMLHSHVKKSLKGGICDEYSIAEQDMRSIFSHPFSETVLLKWVNLTLCLEWLKEYFPDIVVIQIIRHPVPLFLSWQQREWEPGYNLNILLNQPLLMNGPLQPFQTIMKDAKSYWEKAGAFWGAVTYMQLRAHQPGWYLLEHEWYCMDAATRIRWIVEKAGLTWNNNISEFLSPGRKNLSGPGYGKRRDPKKEIHKWETKIEPSALDSLQGVLCHFELPFYKNLNPEAFWLSKPESFSQ